MTATNPAPERSSVIGFDLGGVIIQRLWPEERDVRGGYAQLADPPVDGAMEAIARLVAERFAPERACIISRAGGRESADRLEWLKIRGFYEKTGMRPDRVFFCGPDGTKVRLCRDLGVTHFIDNKMEILEDLPMVPYRYLFRKTPLADHEQARLSAAGGITIVDSWDAVLRHLLA